MSAGKWFFTADCHFGHANIIKFCKRPFLPFMDSGLCDLVQKGTIPHTDIVVSRQSVMEMDDCIINSINNVVGEDDNLVIVGDFCFSKSNKRNAAQFYRERINCKNVYLILGNHDNRTALTPLFTAIYENYLFKIDGQHIFASHYPARSWDRAFYGSWMVYGHVHNMYHPEDSGDLMPSDKKICRDGFTAVLKKHFGQVSEGVLQELLAVCASTKGSDLTVDVGVDNVRPGFSFGTPWSMDELRAYMEKKRVLRESKRKIIESLKKT